MVWVRNIASLRAWKHIFFARLIWLLPPILYIMLVLGMFTQESVLKFFMLICSIVSYGFYAINLNDFFDKSYDMRVGKRTGMEKISVAGVAVLLFGSIATCLTIAWALAGFYSLIFLFGMACTTLYSHPKTRLKEKGILGLVSNCLAEFIPFLFVLALFGYFTADAAILTGLYLSVCLTDTIHHQLVDDFWSDRKLKLRTFAVVTGYEKTARIHRVCMISTVVWLSIFSIFFSKIDHLYMIFLGLMCFYLLHPSINPEIKKAFKLPLYFVDFIYVGLFSIFPLYFALLMFLHNFLCFPILLLTILCTHRFLLTIANRAKLFLS